MNTRERIVIYGALAVLAGLNVAALCNVRAPAAYAQDAPAGPALGPAESLTLGGEDPLVLRNRDGRLAWSEEPYGRAVSLAFVHVGRALGPLLEAEHYVEEYARLQEEITAQDHEITERIEAFGREHRDTDPDDPDAAEIQRAFQALLQERERFRQDGTRQLGELAATQIERAYRDLVAAVEVVAERRGIDVVFRFLPTANEFQSANPPQAYTSIRARIALKYPQDLDITDLVLEELAVE